ncbi:MAG TPA: hypothetical protein VGK02_00155 [Candidatus Aquicultor sp.]
MAEPEKDETRDMMESTEIDETRYMGEGPPGRNPGGTEVTETAYMGEPPERHDGVHETEYNKGRQGPRIGKATIEPTKGQNKGEEKKTA